VIVEGDRVHAFGFVVMLFVPHLSEFVAAMCRGLLAALVLLCTGVAVVQRLTQGWAQPIPLDKYPCVLVQ